MFSAVASAPSIFNAVTLSSREPRDTYPIAFTSCATVLNITDVLFVIFAASVVLSTLFPSASFSSIPNSSMNAPLVPDPSSLEQIVISPEAAAIAVVPIVATPNNAAIATAKPFFMIYFLLFFAVLFVFLSLAITGVSYCPDVKYTIVEK